MNIVPIASEADAAFVAASTVPFAMARAGHAIDMAAVIIGSTAVETAAPTAAAFGRQDSGIACAVDYTVTDEVPIMVRSTMKTTLSMPVSIAVNVDGDHYATRESGMDECNELSTDNGISTATLQRGRSRCCYRYYDLIVEPV